MSLETDIEMVLEDSGRITAESIAKCSFDRCVWRMMSAIKDGDDLGAIRILKKEMAGDFRDEADAIQDQLPNPDPEHKMLDDRDRISDMRSSI